MPVDPDNVLVVGERQQWQAHWHGDVLPFEDLTLERLQARECVVLCPGHVRYLEACKLVLDWKRQGLLDGVELILGTYKGRHIWTPENDPLVSQWVVHSTSEREVLDSGRLAFVPLCGDKAVDLATTGAGGYLFMGGRKWREPILGIEAMVRSRLPGLVITDFCPEYVPAQIDVIRERVPPERYFHAMARARVVLLPLKGTPVSHGQTDAVNAVLLGRPLVVTAGASCDDYVRNGVTGILVADNSIEAWTTAVLEAYARADEMAAATREFARAFNVSRYAGYLRQIVDHPGSRRVDERYRRPAGHPDRGEWHRAQQALADRQAKLAQGVAIRAANNALRERRLEAAIAAARKCLEGDHRLAALRVLIRALGELQPGEALQWAHMRIAEFGERGEFLSDLADILWALERRIEALEAARSALILNENDVAGYRRLAAMLKDLGQTADALHIAGRGLVVAPDDKGLLRLQREIQSAHRAAAGL
jgi:hypothetical protein